jgi:hypothetical protein
MLHVVVIQTHVILVLNLSDALSPFLWLAGWGIDEQGWSIDEHSGPSLHNYSTFNLLKLGCIDWHNDQSVHNGDMLWLL